MKKRIGILLIGTILLVVIGGCGRGEKQETEIKENNSTKISTGNVIGSGEVVVKKEDKKIEDEVKKIQKEKKLLLETAKEYFGTGYTFLGTGVAQRAWKVVPGNVCRNYKNTKLGIKRNLDKHWTGCKILEIIQLDGNQEVIYGVRIVKTSDKVKENHYNDFKDFPQLSGYIDIIGYYTLDKEKYPLVDNQAYSGTAFPHEGYEYNPPKPISVIARKEYNRSRYHEHLDGENNKYYLVMDHFKRRDPIIDEAAFPHLNIYNSKKRNPTMPGQKGDDRIRIWIIGNIEKYVSFFNVK